MTFEKTESLNRASLSFKDASIGDAMVLKMLGPIYQGKEMDREGKGKKMAPAYLAHVLQESDMQEYNFIVPAVIKSTLEEVGEKGYIDHWFKFTFQGQAKGKRYKQYAVDRGTVNEKKTNKKKKK